MSYFEEQIAQNRRRRHMRLAVIGVVVTAIAAGAYLYLRSGGRMPAPPLPSWLETPTPGGEVAPPAETPAPSPEPTLTPVAEGTLDETVRRLIGVLSSHPMLAELLATPGLLRRFVVTVDNIAEGKSPRQSLTVIDPRDGFSVSRGGEPWFIDAKSYARYDAIAAAVESIDADGAAAAFAELESRLDQSYRELGYPDRRFRDALRRAIERLERVPIPEGRVEVRPKLESHRFADPRLEALSPAEKHLVRMGPANARKVQAKLKELAAAIELETDC